MKKTFERSYMQRCSHLFKPREALASCCFQTAGSYLGTWLTLPGSSYISWNLVAIPRVLPPGCRDFWVEKLPSFIVAWKKGKVFFPTKLVQYNNLQLLPLGKRWLKKTVSEVRENYTTPHFWRGTSGSPLSRSRVAKVSKFSTGNLDTLKLEPEQAMSSWRVDPVVVCCVF